MDTAERTAVEPSGSGGAAYDGFISYSHSADDLVAPRLQAGLQRFAKPWWKRRAVRIFRDESSLAANPHLWSSITEALDDSSWFVLLLSEDAASSEWVGKEIEHWVANKQADRILPVVTDGSFGWDNGDVAGSSVPSALHGVFSEEPRWVDLRFARGEEHLDLQNPDFSAAVADIAATIRGVPKDELASEEVKQHRRTVRTAWAAGITVTILAIAAIVAGVFAIGQRNDARDSQALAETEATRANQEADRAEVEADRAEANAQAEAEARLEAELNATLAKSRELGAAAVEALEADRNPKLAALLALESLRLAGSLEEQPVTLVDTLFRSVAEDRLIRTIETGSVGLNNIALSPDDAMLALSAEAGTGVVMYSVPAGEVVWEFEEETADTFTLPWFSPDGSRLAIAVADSGSYDVKGLEPDELNSRVIILDAMTGEEVQRLELAECGAPDSWGWSPDGSLFVITNGQEPCQRDDATDGTWVELLDGNSLEPLTLIDASGSSLGPRVRFTADGDMHLFGFDAPLEVREAPDYSVSTVYEAVEGYTDVAPDGSHAVTFSASNPERLALINLSTGERVDILRPLESNPTLPIGVGFSPDSSRVIVQSESEGTLVWEVASGRQAFDLESGPRGNGQMTRDGSLLYTSHADGTIKVWNLEPITVGQTVIADLEGYNWVNGNSFAISDDFGAGQAISFEGEPSSRLLVFDPATGEVTGTVDEVSRPSGLTNGRFLFHRRGGDVAVYDATSGEVTQVAGCQSSNEEPPFLCDDTGEEQIWVNYTVSLDQSRILLLPDTEPATFELVDSETLDVLDSGAWEFGVLDWVLTFTDEWVAGLPDAGSPLMIIDWETGDEITRFVDCGCNPELSASGRWYANPWDSVLRLIDLTDWTDYRYELGLGFVRGVAFSPDESVVALGDQDEMVLVEVESGEVIRRIPIGDASDFHWIDNQTLLFGNREGLWATVTLDPLELSQATLDNLTRGFTNEECDRYGIDSCPASLDAVRNRYGSLGG